MTSAELKHQTKLQEWAAQIQNCRSSGLPVRAWCRQEGINASTYYRWERELLTAADQVLCSAVPAMTFAELPEPKKMSRNVPKLLSHVCLSAGRFDVYRQIDIFGTSLPIIPQNRPPYGENADSAPRRAGSAPGLQKRAGDPERGLLQCGYLEYARKRKVTIWPRVQLSSGLNVVLEVPSVTLPETAQPTASA